MTNPPTACPRCHRPLARPGAACPCKPPPSPAALSPAPSPSRGGAGAPVVVVKLPQSLAEALKRQREKAEAERRRKRAGINLKPPTAGDEFALKTLLASKRRTLGSRTDLGAQRKGRLA